MQNNSDNNNNNSSALATSSNANLAKNDECPAMINNDNAATTPRSLPTPYRGVLDERIEPGQTLVVKGVTVADANRFSINLHNKSADFSGNDVPLHISVRFDQEKIVLNSMAKSEWGKEERKSNPLKKGQPFDIRIRAHDSKFQIIIDGKEFKEYDYRLPLQSITHFSIDGNLTIQYIHWSGKYYPIPYETGLPSGFPVGKRLNLYGTVEKKADFFVVNLLRKNGDIALHFNPRFKKQKAIVRNALQAGKWSNEESEGAKMPFERGHCFDLSILNEPNHFTISINGQHFANFVHRSEPNDIFGLQIQGQIELTGIELE